MGEEFEFKGTPGQWRIEFMPHDHGGGDFWVKSDINPVVHYGTDIMAEDFGEHNGYPREQRMADAKLIAAAPEMLIMFKELLSWASIESKASVDRLDRATKIFLKATE